MDAANRLLLDRKDAIPDWFDLTNADCVSDSCTFCSIGGSPAVTAAFTLEALRSPRRFAHTRKSHRRDRTTWLGWAR